MKDHTTADRTVAALRLACVAAVDWHAERHPYRARQAQRWAQRATGYDACRISPAHRDKATALWMACSYRAAAYHAAAGGDAHQAWAHWQAMRGFLLDAGLTAKVWKR